MKCQTDSLRCYLPWCTEPVRDYGYLIHEFDPWPAWLTCKQNRWCLKLGGIHIWTLLSYSMGQFSIQVEQSTTLWLGSTFASHSIWPRMVGSNLRSGSLLSSSTWQGMTESCLELRHRIEVWLHELVSYWSANWYHDLSWNAVPLLQGVRTLTCAVWLGFGLVFVRLVYYHLPHVHSIFQTLQFWGFSWPFGRGSSTICTVKHRHEIFAVNRRNRWVPQLVNRPMLLSSFGSSRPCCANAVPKSEYHTLHQI